MVSPTVPWVHAVHYIGKDQLGRLGSMLVGSFLIALFSNEYKWLSVFPLCFLLLPTSWVFWFTRTGSIRRPYLLNNRFWGWWIVGSLGVLVPHLSLVGVIAYLEPQLNRYYWISPVTYTVYQCGIVIASHTCLKTKRLDRTELVYLIHQSNQGYDLSGLLDNLPRANSPTNLVNPELSPILPPSNPMNRNDTGSGVGTKADSVETAESGSDMVTVPIEFQSTYFEAPRDITGTMVVGGKTITSVLECPICLEPMQKGELIGMGPCAHQFHYGCLDDWITKKQVCPLCVFNLPE